MEYSNYMTDTGIVRCDIFSENFKTDCVSVQFFMLLEKETASMIALLCGVLKRGNTRYGEMDRISAFLEKNYGADLTLSTSKAGELQELSFTVRFLDDRYAIEGEKLSENLISLLYSVIFEPITENGGFKATFVEQEKQNLKNKILSLVNDKRVYSLEKCKRIMFKDERYGVYELGDIDTVDRITAYSLYDFYKSLLDGAMLFVSYAGSKRDTTSLLSGLMSALDLKPRMKISTEIRNRVFSVTDELEEMKVAQSKLNMGFRLGDTAKNDPFAAKLFNVIYGSSPTSKLFMNVREKLSLCYYCASAADAIKNVMFVYSGVETKNCETARKEILNQLELMKSGDFTSEEFENARAYLIDSYIQSGDSLGGLIIMNTAAALAGHGLTPEKQIEQIRLVTPERVQRVAQDVELDTVFWLKGIGGNDNAE